MTIIQQGKISTLLNKLSFLVVDDFESFRLSMRDVLHSLGAGRIELVSNAADAIERCAYEQFDVVLCDFNLGEGKNGQNILEELRQRKLLRRTSLFLMITAETSREMVMGARECQPDAYLTKPINRAILENRLAALVQQRNALFPINRELDRENYPEAISLCLQAIPHQPRYKSWLLKTLADLYYRVGDFIHARKIYEDILKQRDLTWARVGRAKVLLAEQYYKEAASALYDAVRRHPDHMEAYDLLAEVLSRQGRLQEAQTLLQQAVRHSPYALHRQKALAMVATDNQDIGTAVEAWRRTVELGRHSINDRSAHYLALAQALCELSEGELSAQGREQADEAITTLKRMEARFANEEAILLRSRIIQCRALAGQNNLKEADEILTTVEQEFQRPDSLPNDLTLAYARTLFCLGRKETARQLLIRLANSASEQTDLLKQIEALLDEPVGFRQKLIAHDLYRDAIRAFESGALEQAITAFENALAIVPSHAALNLNLIQVLLKKYQHTESRDPAILEECRRRLHTLADLPKQHRQYPRYRSLQRKLEEMTP